MTPIFFDTFFNLEKYLDHEQRDPFASHRAEDDGPEVSAMKEPCGRSGQETADATSFNHNLYVKIYVF